jgi:hypothetical protein
MEIDELPENDERLLKKAEIKRDEMGRFEQAGTGLIKKSKTISKKSKELMKPEHGRGGLRAGAGRPKGSKGKITLQASDSDGGPAAVTLFQSPQVHRGRDAEGATIACRFPCASQTD